MTPRVVLSAIQLRRALENAGGLWTPQDLLNMQVSRYGDSDLPPEIRIGRLNYYTGYDMLSWAEGLGRAAAAENLHEAIQGRRWQITEKGGRR